MNKDLEQFGVEHLKEMLDEDINPLDGFSSVPNYWLHHFARIALSVKQAKPVGHFSRVNGDGIWFEQWTDKLGVPLYATPQPAHTEQVKPPVISEWNNAQCLEFLSVAFRHNDIDGEISFDDIRLGVKFALAAAPKPDVTLISEGDKPDGWIKCSDNLPAETEDADGGATGYLVRYENDRVPNGGFNIGVSNVVYLRKHWRGLYSHWMPLPAAPKPESE